jgi:hypothetical protein
MREHRWESVSPLSFDDILSVADRLGQAGLTSMHPGKEMITYIEEWEVTDLDEIDQLELWPTEDVTLLHVLDQWEGDFFLLVGGYHTVFQQHQSVNTYCSIAHPWRIDHPLATLQPVAWLWVGFRHTHGFIRVRVHTTEIIAPGESVAQPREQFWLKDRQEAFRAAIEVLQLPIEVNVDNQRVSLHTSRTDTPLFCSWPDAFGPCQFELNSPDSFEFLVPASQLAATIPHPAEQVRVYLTGFSTQALRDFNHLPSNSRLMYRCSLHCRLEEIPEIFSILHSRGRIYGSLAEFQTAAPLPEGVDAAAIVGLVGSEGQFRLEIRLNQHPLSHQETEQWFQQLVGHDLVYAPLPVFP